MKIAVYGKGGIGKSTISANISASLSERGQRILQIGCDPKHDSTRLLLGQKIPITVMDYIRTVNPEDRSLNEIIFRGYGDVACIEAGGPEPGVGCAGRGIITMFELLEHLGLQSGDFDITIYDVLGDVVCGGFAVPIRKEYADSVFIVTSGEYMSLYAANNILRGIKNFTSRSERVAGIIYNSRGITDEEDRVEKFAKGVRLPIIASIPKSGIFSLAEKKACTVVQMFPQYEESALFRMIADYILNVNAGHSPLFHAYPLSDEELESAVLESKNQRNVERYNISNRVPVPREVITLSPSVRKKRPLIGCAFAGAVSVLSQISRAAIIMHGPRSCSMMIGEKLIDTEIRIASVSGIPYYSGKKQELFSTDLSDEDFIHGGEKKLEIELESAIEMGFSHLFVISGCPSAIIGDDNERIGEDVSGRHPGVVIIPVPVQGNLTGDYSQGVIDTYRTIVSMIPKKSPEKRTRSVNIIAGKFLAVNNEKNYREIKSLLKRLGISINCQFVNRCSIDSIYQFNQAMLNLPSDIDDLSIGIQSLIQKVSDIPFLSLSLPIGFKETERWLLAVADIFGSRQEAEDIIRMEQEIYKKRIEEIKPFLIGKRILISTPRRSIDWILDLARDTGMEIGKIGLTYSPFNDHFTTKYNGLIPVDTEYDADKRTEDIRTLNPDLVLYSYPQIKPSDSVHNLMIPYSPGFGFQSGCEWAEKWSRLLRVPCTEGWKSDGEALYEC